MAELPERCDALIVGGGPAGLSAAAELRRMGVGAVHVLDRERETGGVPRHCAHSPFGLGEFGRPMLGPAFAAALTRRAEAAGARLHAGVSVTALRPGGAVETASDAGPRRIEARAVLLATGARESSRAARLIGGAKPGGVLSAGALQGLAHLHRRRPFERPVILGTELVSFSALATCRLAGIRPLAMIEPGERITARRVFQLAPLLLGASLRLRTELVAIHGGRRVAAATLRGPAGEEEVETDGVIVSGGFRPENALLRASHLAVDPHTLGPEIDQFGRCSDPAYFAAGNLLRGIETAGWCWREGRAVAQAMARALAGALPPMEGATRLAFDAAALRFVLPQRLAPGDAPPAFDRLQMRVARPFSGVTRVGGRAIALTSRPERRITRPLRDFLQARETPDANPRD